MRVNDIIARIESMADPRHAADWDASGVQIAGRAETCSRLAVALDPLPETIRRALDHGAEFILTHHPLLLKPRAPSRLDDYHAVLSLVLRHEAWLYAAHTSLDVRLAGPAGWLAEALGLTGRRPLAPLPPEPARLARLESGSAEDRARLLVVLESRPEVSFIHPVAATRVECLCLEASWPKLESALTDFFGTRPAIPYIPAALPRPDLGYGVIGDLPEPLTPDGLAARLAALIDRQDWTLAGVLPERISRLAYCPGSGADLAPAAFALGAEVYLTGDLKYHQAQAVPEGRCLIDVGHFSLEERMMRELAGTLGRELSPLGVTVTFYPGRDPLAPRRAGGTPTGQNAGDRACT